MNDLLEILRFFRVVNLSVEKVNEVRRGEVDGIKLHNCRAKSDALLICVFQITMWVIFLWVCAMFWEYKIPKLYLIFVVWFAVNVFFSILIGRVAYYSYKYADECYLTEMGIVSIPALYTHENSRFEYYKSYSNGEKQSHIEVKLWQRGRIIRCYFIVLEREDEAEEIIKKMNM